MVFTRALLDRVLSVASIAHAGQRILGDADFTDATFAEHANFSRCSFAGNARFAKTDWLEGADFSSTRFGRAASFAGAKFAGGAVFAGAQFSNEADFSGSAFVESSGTQGPWLATVLAEGGVSFRQAIFGGNATFVDVQVGWADFSEARFKTECTFRGARFDDLVQFGSTTFLSTADLANASGTGSLDFSMCSLEEGVNLTSARLARVVLGARCARRLSIFDGNFTTLHVSADVKEGGRVGRIDAESVILNASSFADRPSFEIRAERVAITRSQFDQGVEFYLAGGDVLMNDLRFGRHSTMLSGDVESPRQGPKPRLLSLAETDVANLALVAVDLRACHFAGARNLDQLQLGAGCELPSSPDGWRWTQRAVTAEEADWRMHNGGPKAQAAWQTARVVMPRWVVESPPFVRKPQALEASEISRVYRALRRGLENSKDEPGAADFYYGEMEMRRLAAPLLSRDRVILTLYWLVSGYALRASRALLVLCGVLAISTLLFAAGGFRPDASLEETLLFSLGTSVRIDAGPDPDELRGAGEALHVALGVLGPAFYGLALLSLRGRIKR